MEKRYNMNAAPTVETRPVVKPGEFVFAAAHLDHGHVYGQCNGLIAAGGTLKWIYDPQPERVADFVKAFPQAKVARSLDEILDDPEVQLVAAAAIPNERGPIGCRVMRGGKHYYTDKAPFTTLAQLEEARVVARETGRKYMVFYGERTHVECGVYAGDLVQGGAIGRVIQVLGLGPHRLSKAIRPAWFFNKEQYGGILCDIASHQFDQYLFYSGATDGTVASSAVGNFANSDTPELEDFGECSIIGDNGTSSYIRVDWFTPAGLKDSFGDGRTIILGTKGYIELRKYTDVARKTQINNLILVDEKGEHFMNVSGKIGLRFDGDLILDCLNGTENAMTQAHAFKAAELALKAQAAARVIAGPAAA